MMCYLLMDLTMKNLINIKNLNMGYSIGELVDWVRFRKAYEKPRLSTVGLGKMNYSYQICPNKP